MILLGMPDGYFCRCLSLVWIAKLTEGYTDGIPTRECHLKAFTSTTEWFIYHTLKIRTKVQLGKHYFTFQTIYYRGRLSPTIIAISGVTTIETSLKDVLECFQQHSTPNTRVKFFFVYALLLRPALRLPPTVYYVLRLSLTVFSTVDSIDSIRNPLKNLISIESCFKGAYIL